MHFIVFPRGHQFYTGSAMITVFLMFAACNEVDTKIGVTGKTYQVDKDGKWIRRSKHWKPEEVNDDWWRRNPLLHDMWREMFRQRQTSPDVQAV